MAVTTTTNFELDLTEIVEEAFERAGRESRTGYDLRTATRSLNLMLLEWQNRGINMWTMEEGTVSLVSGTASYVLPADTVDILSHVIRTGSGTSQKDLFITRMSASEYHSILNKNLAGRPNQVLVQRNQAQPTVVLWPVPDSDNYTFSYWRMRRIKDAGTGVNNAEVPFRFVPAMIAGLAYHLAIKIPELTPRISMLKELYEEQYQLAAAEDRERSTWRLVPRMRRR